MRNNPLNATDFFGLAPENPFHGFDPDKLKDLLKDPKQCDKAKDLIKSFKNSIKHAGDRLKDPATKNPDRYSRFIDEMNRRINNLERALPPEEPGPMWWMMPLLVPTEIFHMFFFGIPDMFVPPSTGGRSVI